MKSQEKHKFKAGDVIFYKYGFEAYYFLIIKIEKYCYEYFVLSTFKKVSYGKHAIEKNSVLIKSYEQ